MYVVMFTSTEGMPSNHRTETLDEALQFIAHLRNNEGIPDAKLYQMTEIPLEVKTVYQVQVGATGPGGTETATVTPAAGSAFETPATEPVSAGP